MKDKIAEVIKNKMDFGFSDKPNYLLHKGLYPSSGVERMNRQEKQVLELSQAILDLIAKELPKEEKNVDLESMVNNIKKEIKELTRTEHIEPVYLDFVECELSIINNIIDSEYNKAEN